MSLSKQLVRFLHSRFFQVAVPAMGISRRLRKSRRSGRFSNVHLFLLTVASAMKCQVQTVENGQYSYLASIFKIFFPSAIPFCLPPGAMWTTPTLVEMPSHRALGLHSAGPARPARAWPIRANLLQVRESRCMKELNCLVGSNYF